MASVHSIVGSSGGFSIVVPSSASIGSFACVFGKREAGASAASVLLTSNYNIYCTKLWVSAVPCVSFGIAGSWVETAGVGKIGGELVFGVKGVGEVWEVKIYGGIYLTG